MIASDSLVTVVVPAFNGARHIGATLRSLASQTHRPIEVIVVDDGSTDDTVEVARATGVPHEIVTQPNLGVAVARNRGLARARGRWVGFVDQDDLWRSDRVANLVSYGETNDVRAVASTERPFAAESDRAALAAVGDGRERWPQVWIADGGEDALLEAPLAPASASPVTEEITIARLMEGAAMLTTAVLYDRETAIAAGGFAPHARALDDHILNLNVARMTGPIHRIDTKDLLYRVHPNSTSTLSPMVGPVLSALAGVRMGGIFPPARRMGSNLEHLLYGLPDSALPMADQLALLQLTVPAGTRTRWLARWTKRTLGNGIRRRRR